MYQACTQRHYLDQSQKLALKQLLTVKQDLKHPEIPNALRGMEGLIKADNMLKEKNSAGLLIGGLAESIWSQRRKKEELNQRKDVDVLILDTNYVPEEDFEGGIDWWIPETGRIEIKTDASRFEADETWYSNGNGVVLSYGVKKNYELNPGLHLPSDSWVIKMRKSEASANIDYKVVKGEFDDEVFEKFEERLRKKIKTRLPKFIRDHFSGQILSSVYEDNFELVSAIELVDFDLEKIRAINTYKN